MLKVFPEIISISKEEINEYPLKAFEGEICVVDTEEQFESAIAYLRKLPVLGFDTETKPSFTKGQVNKVALLQLSDRDKAFLFRVQENGLPKELVSILQNKRIVKVGVAIRDDIKALQKIVKFKPANFCELQDYVKSYGIENFGLKTLSAILLGFRISKSQQLSNWESVSLSSAQQVYAATDAWVSYELYIKLKELEAQGLIPVGN